MLPSLCHTTTYNAFLLQSACLSQWISFYHFGLSSAPLQYFSVKYVEWSHTFWIDFFPFAFHFSSSSTQKSFTKQALKLRRRKKYLCFPITVFMEHVFYICMHSWKYFCCSVGREQDLICLVVLKKCLIHIDRRAQHSRFHDMSIKKKG